MNIFRLKHLVTAVSGSAYVVCMLVLSPRTLAAQTASTAVIPIDSGKVIQIILGLVLVLLVIGGLTWFLRHVMRFQPTVGGQLQILGGLSMGPRERVVLLKVGDTQMLLGVSPGRIQTLHVLDKPVVETPEVATLPDSGFSRHLSRFLRSDRGRRQDG